MFNPVLFPPDYELDECQFEHVLGQLAQQWPIREHVARVLREANSAFAAQYSQPDGHTFMQTCDDLLKFFDLRIALEYAEQKSVVQVLQVACAMHENAVNNPELTPTQRSAHYLATTSLVPLCKRALEGSIMDIDLWCEVFDLKLRAEKAHAKATDALDLSKYLDFKNINDDNTQESGNGASTTSTASSPVFTASKKSVNSRDAVHSATTDARPNLRSEKLKDKTPETLNDQPYKAAPLGRRHTMPALLQTTFTPYPSRMGRTTSKVSTRALGLHHVVLQETEE